MLSDEYFFDHIQTRDKKPPAVIYKYTSVETASIILSSGTLLFQSPLRYNDPFDSQWDFLWPVRTPEFRQQRSELLENAIRDQSTWPSDIDPVIRDALICERKELVEIPSPQADSKIAWLKDELRGLGEVPDALYLDRVFDLRRRSRVCCLCEINDSILMWSHYAAEHRGVVLGFDTAALESGFRRPLEPVEYLSHPPKLIDTNAWVRSAVFGLATPNFLGSPREWALTKSDLWSYEREWRFFWMAARGTPGEFEDFRFPRAALVELVLGCKIDNRVADEVHKLATAIHGNVRTISMNRHPSRFELMGTPHPES